MTLTPAEPTLRVALYVRDIDPAERRAQLRALRDLAESRHATVVEVFTDDMPGRRRRGFAALVALIEGDGIEAVVTTSLDRLTRQPSEVESLVRKRVVVITPDGTYRARPAWPPRRRSGRAQAAAKAGAEGR